MKTLGILIAPEVRERKIGDNFLSRFTCFFWGGGVAVCCVRQMLVSCKGVQAKYIIRGLQGRMRVGLNVSTVMGEPTAPICACR